MIEWHLIRHGQTEWNIQSRMQGWLDSPLTAEGIVTANILSTYLMGHKWDCIYSSPSSRAVKTLEIAMQGKMREIVSDRRLMEIGLGSWQGLTLEEIEEKDPINYHLYWHAPSEFLPVEGESFFDLKKRVHDFINEVIGTHFKKGEMRRVLIVTHGVTLMMFQVIFFNKTVEDIRTFPLSKNVEVLKFIYDGESFFKSL